MARGRDDLDVAAERRDDLKRFAELQRGLTRFEIDNEADTNAAHCRKLCLLQVLRLAFAAHEETK